MSLAGVSMGNLTLLILYNVIFVLPLIIIILMFYRGMSAHAFEAWRLRHRKTMRGITGVVLLTLGIWMIWYIMTL
jgi:cytochrome c biogenesis protein CcdA